MYILSKMGKLIKIKQSDLRNIIESAIIIEQSSKWNPKGLKFGDREPKNQVDGPIHQLQKNLMDNGFLKTKSMVPTGYFGPLTKDALDRAEGKKSNITNKETPKKEVPNKETPKTVGSLCPSISKSPNIKYFENDFNFWKEKYPSSNTTELIDRMINRNAQVYMSTKIRQRTACQIAFTSIRPQFDSKYLFVIDTNEKLVYLFAPKQKPNEARKVIAKDFIISGKQKQSQDIKQIVQNLKLAKEKIRDLGYVESKSGTWTNKKYPGQTFKTFDVLTKENFRWLPAGNYEIQSVGDVGGHYSEFGKGGNIAGLRTLDDKPLTQALHSIYTGDNRVEASQQAERLLKNPNDPVEIDKFVNILKKGGVNLNWSYGCINFPARFLPYFRKYAANAILVNVSETEGNYLVQNTNNYIEKMTNSKSCPSPKSLGAENMV